MRSRKEFSRRAVLRAGLLSLGAACTAPRQGTPAAISSTAARPPAPTPSSTPSRSSPARRDVVLLCRDAWDARDPTGAMTTHAIDRITVHHSAVVAEDPRRGPERLRQFQELHVDRHCWPDIAYHLGIDRGGHLYDLRPWDRVGDTATAYDPTGHLLVLVDGHFDQQQPTSAQLGTLADVLAWAAEHFEVGLGTVTGHRDHAATSCPGDALYARIGHLVEEADQRRDAGGIRLERACGPAARERIAGIESGRAS